MRAVRLLRQAVVRPAKAGQEFVPVPGRMATGLWCECANQRAQAMIVSMPDDRRSDGRNRGIDSFVCGETSELDARGRPRSGRGRYSYFDTLNTRARSAPQAPFIPRYRLRSRFRSIRFKRWRSAPSF